MRPKRRMKSKLLEIHLATIWIDQLDKIRGFLLRSSLLGTFLNQFTVLNAIKGINRVSIAQSTQSGSRNSKKWKSCWLRDANMIQILRKVILLWSKMELCTVTKQVSTNISSLKRFILLKSRNLSSGIDLVLKIYSCHMQLSISTSKTWKTFLRFIHKLK